MNIQKAYDHKIVREKYEVSDGTKEKQSLNHKIKKIKQGGARNICIKF